MIEDSKTKVSVSCSLMDPWLFQQPLHNFHEQLKTVVSCNVLEHCQMFSEYIGWLGALQLTTTKLALPGKMT